MPHPLRIDPEAGIHHVYTRGTKRWSVFLDDPDRLRLLGGLDRVCERYGLIVVAYCLMDNHIHLIVQCPDGGLSAAMRDLKSLYARGFNDRHRSSGPIFEARFGSKLINTDLQLRETVRYVHRNPYAISPSLALETFRWSSHPAYLGVAPRPAWLRPGLALPLFDGYRRVIETPRSNDAVQNNVDFLRSTVRVSDTGTVASTPSLVEILVSVAQAAGRKPIEVHPTCRNGLIGLAVLLAHDYGQYSYREIYEPFGYRTESAAARAGRRSRHTLATRLELAAICEQAKRSLWPVAA